MGPSILTLTTDFGLSDHFVGTMKGVVLGISPGTRIVDISHEVAPFDIPAAAFLIAQSYRYFPPKTVHVVVVDPGVGTSRRPILAEAGGHFFVAPDNGVLSMVFADATHKVRHITAAKYFLKQVSHTFHGRDVFAPVGAHVASGVPPARMGKPIDDYMRLHLEKPDRTARRAWTGTVLKIDRFGNLITNFRAADFEAIWKQPFEISIGLRTVHRRASNYAECEAGELFAIEGSSGYIEISASQASAAAMLGCGTGAPVEIRLL